jgi:alanyl-tRNA synthetase
VIADHARALSFMIADGILPSNEGRGYVERRLLRRAARFGREIGLEKPFLHEITKTVGDKMGHHYPELIEKRVQIEKIILTEEERFASTLVRGMDLLEEIFGKMKKAGETVVSGVELFKMHDTFGFPLDLATDIAEDRGFTVDREGFNAAMTKQRDQGRSAWAGSGEESLPPSYRVVANEVGETQFVGYDSSECGAVIKAIIKKGEPAQRLEEGEEGEVVLDRTPFYAESGGQVGDTGTFETSEASAHVAGARSPFKKMTLHAVKVTRGALGVGDTVMAAIDAGNRRATENHHTATHLLQAALRLALGDHVHQAGSMVSPERLRFDFTHFEGIEYERMQDIERLVNEFIRRDIEVDINHLAIAEARKTGAMALFGEKYEDVVRVIHIGDVSKELCGGCHVRRTGVIGCFKVLSESSVAAGVRRIEAVCGEPCVELIQNRDRQLARVARLVNAGLDEIDARVSALIEENKTLQREVNKWKQAAATGSAVDYLARVREVRGVKVLATEVEGLDASGLRMTIDSLRDKLGSGVVVLGSRDDDKVLLCAGVTKDLTGKVKAGDVIKNLAPIVGGGGGGKPDLAQAGGKLPDKLPEAIERAAEVVESLLK